MSIQFSILVVVMVALLVVVAAVPPPKGVGSPIHDAVRNDDPTAILEAIAAGANVNEIGPGGQTPLLHAILSGKVEAVKTLLDAKADYSIPEKDGFTVFHAAGFQGRAEIVRILADHRGEDGERVILDSLLDTRHRDGFYPIHRACWGKESRHAATVQAFLELGVPLGLRAGNGKTCRTMTRNVETHKILTAQFNADIEAALKAEAQSKTDSAEETAPKTDSAEETASKTDFEEETAPKTDSAEETASKTDEL